MAVLKKTLMAAAAVAGLGLAALKATMGAGKKPPSATETAKARSPKARVGGVKKGRTSKAGRKGRAAPKAARATKAKARASRGRA
jgi:hypothetical protein